MSDQIIIEILAHFAKEMAELTRDEIRLVSGVEKDVCILTARFESLKEALIAAEVKKKTDEVSLEKLKDALYEAEYLLLTWITRKSKDDLEAEESSSSIYQKWRSWYMLPYFCIKRVALRRGIALQIKEINRSLDEIIDANNNKFIGIKGSDGLERPKIASYVEESEIRGRNVDRDNIVREMLSVENQKKGLNVISILGAGGMGKTTLAQRVYNSVESQHFSKRMWVCVTERFDEMRVAKAIVECAEGKSPYVFELESVLLHVRKIIARERYLLVLDDVWTRESQKWEQIFISLRTGEAGSTILVTTRNEEVSNMMGSRYKLLLGKLPAEDSWSLFSRFAFSERSKEECEELEVVGREIARKCDGSPLVIKTIGSMMRFKTDLNDWKEVLCSKFWTLKVAEEVLLPALMFSYYDLPSHLRQCFSFCAFFPKDHVIEADNLIKLWMAQGYIESTENEEIETTGQKYLQDLAMRSFFQDLEKDKDGKTILRVTIHDMLHDLAQYLTKNECSLIEVNSDLVQEMESSQKVVRRLTLVRSEDAQFPTSIPNTEKLQSFWVQGFYDCPPILNNLDRIEPDLFLRLSRLKALDLSRNRLGELPEEVGKLMILRYLNLSHNPLWKLPETLGDLYNLQTLNLTYCEHLKKLPRSIRKLVNLRHLEMDHTNSLKKLPKGVSSLTSLQTLTKFIFTGQENNSIEEACRIMDLNSLNNLRGHLKIEGLGHIEDAEEAKKAEMHRKRHLSDLHLDFSPITQSCRRKDEVIEALQVNENLQVLQISLYGGLNFPTWITNLTKMRELFLQNCQNCTTLPPLGKLPSLVTLCIEGMQSLKSIGPEFLGLDINDNNISDEALQGTAFPKLKKLKISNMASWEEWNFSNGPSSDENTRIMPRLKILKLSHCSKLKMLPQRLLLPVTPLSKLRIDKCSLLQEQLENRKEMSKIIRKVRIS